MNPRPYPTKERIVNASTFPQTGFDPDDTILIPQPGGRVAERARTEDAPRAPVLPAAASGLNPLVRAANPLIELALPLRQRAAMTDMEALRGELVRMMRAFEHDARASGADTETLAAARYCLCTCIDEAISARRGAAACGRAAACS